LQTGNEQIDGRHARFELKTLLDTSRMLIESHDLDFVLNNLLLISMGKLFCTKSAILLWNASKGYYEVSKNKGKTGLQEAQPIHLELSAKLRNQSVIYSARDNDGSLPAIFVENELCVLFNLRTSAEHIGYLCMGAKANREEFSHRELEFIENLVNISAVAVANSVLVRQLKNTNLQLDRRVQEIHTLFDLSKEFNANVDLEPILKIFKFALLGQMFIRTFFFLLERKGEAPQVVVQSGMKSPISEDEMCQLLSLKHTVTRTTDSHRQRFNCVSTNQIEALIRLDLQDDVAILGVGKRATNEIYEPSDFNFLSSLGNLAMLSIQKTYLLEERIENQRIEEELSIARTIQEKLLPNPIKIFHKLDVAAMNVSSQQVGGDYFEILEHDNHLYLAIADVTGKGIPASLLMANLQAMLHVLTPVNDSLALATGKINDIIYKNTPSDKFISFFWGWYDSDTEEFHYVNAGHNPPFLIRDGINNPILLSDGGILLGAMPTISPYKSAHIKLQKNDVIVMYTDGVTEAMDPMDQEYGENRLFDCLIKHRTQDASGIMDAIVEDVKVFTNNNYSDDITMLVLKHR
jgi:phosphoserine phosphatase RsbU/P